MTEETKPAARPVEAKTMIRAASVGQPMAALANEEINRALLGVVIGYATGVGYAQVEDRQTGEVNTIKHLRGSFRAVPHDVKRPMVMSAKCGLPDHVIASVVSALEKGEKEGVVIEVGFELGVERAKNAAGYSWFARPLFSLDDDPLAGLAEKAGIALGAPEAKPALPAPEGNKAGEVERSTAEKVEAEKGKHGKHK